MLVAINFERAGGKQPTRNTKDFPNFKVGDLVLLKNHKKQNWDAKYMVNFHICKIINDRVSDLQDLTGHDRCATIEDIQLLMFAEYIISMLPDIKAFGLAS